MSELVNENEEKLIINIGEAYMPVVEDYQRAKESMFKPIYEKGRNLVKEICEAYDDKNSTNECKINSENYNNIIAFIGERGSGKTSSMLTFSDLLNNDKFLKNGLIEKENDENNLEKFKFVQSDVIDPSQFDKNVNILEIILAGMFKNFKNKANKIESTDRQNIIECFDKVYRNLKTLKKESSSIYDGDVLEALLEMSASMEIKENLSKLISVYLEKVENENNEKSIFVVRIDDIDLNTEHAHAMVEQLRKYLMLPSVIILMALKIEQLHDVVNQTHYISLSELAKMENNGKGTRCISINDKVIDMTEKYLSKIFPIDHRLLMPEPEMFSSSKKFEIRTNLDEKGIEYPSLDHGIREIIYKKTGLHFIKPDKNENPIVPSNLRELVNFVHYIQKFEDVKITSKEKLVRCMNAIIKNESGNEKLDDEIQKKLQTNGKTLEDFSWLLDCPLSEEYDDWKNLCTQKKKDSENNRNKINGDDLSIFNIENDIFKNLKKELNLIIKSENVNIGLIKKQLEKFKNYFIAYWCQNKISREGELLITRFLELDIKKKNKFVILELEKMFEISKLLKIQETYVKNDKINNNDPVSQMLERYIQISTIINNESNISLGDILFTLSILEKLNISKEVLNLTFAIKVMYYIELELLNLSKTIIKEEGLLQEIEYLIGGEYFSSFQKKIISDEKKIINPLSQNLKSEKSRSLCNCKLPKIKDEIEYLEEDKKMATMLFISLMFSRAGNTRENYIIDDEIYYDLYEKLKGRQENYVLSITSPFFNSFRTNMFIENINSDENLEKNIDSDEKCISNVIILEYLFVEKAKSKYDKFENIKNITGCWEEFYNRLSYRMRFFDGISYFSIFNLNFMKVFRKSNISKIDLFGLEKQEIDSPGILTPENNNTSFDTVLDKLINYMKDKKKSRKQLENYWNEVYYDIERDLNFSFKEMIDLDMLDQIINNLIFFKINSKNTSFKCKDQLLEIIEELKKHDKEDYFNVIENIESKLLSQNSEYAEDCANFYYEEAKIYYRNKDYKMAIEFYEKAMELKPENTMYLNNLGNSYYMNNEFDKAIKCYMKAIDMKENNPIHFDNLGLAYYRKGSKEDLDKAIYYHKESCKLNPTNYKYLANLGNAYFCRSEYGDIEKAIDCYKQALDQDNVPEHIVNDIEDKILACQEELKSIESQTEEPQETNLEDSEPKDKE